MKTFALHTLGCKLNFAESSTIARQLEEKGFTRVKFEDSADYYIINTCSVTDQADRKCRQAVYQALRIAPHARVIVIGCYAQLKPDEIASIPGVTMVLGVAEKFKIPSLIENLDQPDGKPRMLTSPIGHADEFVPSYSLGDRTRTFLKVQDGCDYNCAFCTIPLARGGSRSASIEEVLNQIHQIEQQGVKEIVLTGVNIGDFGKPSPGSKRQQNFLQLLQAIEEHTRIERFRISSIEPNLLTDEIIRFVAQSGKFMPHFHMPLQSGSDDILKAMRRRYLTGLYAGRVATIKKYIPHCAIGVDVITGFPGESDQHFLQTYRFLNELDIAYLHVFTYSERDNTAAIHMKGRVPHPVRKERTTMLRILSDKKRRHFYEQFTGEIRPVLWESTNNHGKMYGFTDNYIKVESPYQPEWLNTIMPVHLDAIRDNGNMACTPVNIHESSNITAQ